MPLGARPTSVTPAPSFVTTDRRFGKSQLPDVEPRTACRLTAWRGERVSAQLVLWSADSVGGVECRIGKFRSDGACLPAGIAQARFVRYVLTDTFGPGCGHRRDGDFPVSLAAASTWMRAPRVRCG